MKGVRIGQTPHGYGVFATRGYRPGQVIGRVTGRLVEDPEFGSEYCIDVGTDRSLDPAPPFRFLNHSCEPNCELVSEDVEDDCGKVVGVRVWVEAIRAIDPGEELRIDYAWPADTSIPCGCRSPNCRGWIVAADQVHLVRRRRPRRPQASGRA